MQQKSIHKDLYFEAAVGGGIPIIRPLKECLAGNNITEVMGIVNGTTNYILTKMTQEGMDFGEALKQAQELGFAEADPTADVGRTGRRSQDGDPGIHCIPFQSNL